MMEPEALDTNHGAESGPLHGYDSSPSPEPVSSRWDERTWADNIIKHGSLQESKTKLESRVAEFLNQADPAERNDLELSRMKLLEGMKAAQTEHDKKYPDIPIESMQSKSQEAKARIKAGCRKFSETAYEYSKIMDVLVGQAPEYVALAWGAMKIVLVVQINHEELKQKVKEHMGQIKSKFETVDHLTAYMPKANLVRSVAKAYELFSRFLAKALKYYSLSRFKATWRAFSNPWKTHLQGLVDEIDQTFITIKDIAQFHGLLDGHVNLVVSQKTLQNSQKSITMHERSLARLTRLEDLMEQAHATFICFSKEHEVQQTSNLLRQCVDERLQEPEKCCGPKVKETGVKTETEPQQATSIESEDLNALRDRIFPELRDFHQDLSRREKAIEQAPEMRGHRSKMRNILKIDKVMAWIESESSQLLWIDGNRMLRRSEFNMSFAAPLLVLGESNHESILILRHFCGEFSSHETRSHHILLQALLYQIFQQYPQLLSRKKASLTREHTGDMTVLWNLLVECVEEVNAHCTFIIIDDIDALRVGASNEVNEEVKLLIQRLNTLVQDDTRVVKILLTSSLAKDQTSDGRATLTLPRRRTSLAIVQDELALVPQKIIEIQERRCQKISFAEMIMLYGPNKTVYTSENEEIRAFVVTEMSGMDPRSFESYSPLQLRAWSVDHNGKRMARRYHDLTIPQFAGQRAISSLRYVPAGYLPEESKQRKILIDRGKKWWSISAGVHHVAISPQDVQGIVDQRSRELTTHELGDFQEEFSTESASVLKPLYLMLCPPTIDVFMLQNLKWMTTKVLAIRNYVYGTDFFDHLALPNKAKELLLGLADTQLEQTRSKLDRPFNGADLDLVLGRRAGKVILLYGAPGTGKTLTVEAFADYVQKPLLSIGYGEIGYSAKEAETALAKNFHLAQAWDCVSLLEDADDMLSHSNSGMKSNMLVKTFRQVLDQFTGLLFLTSNQHRPFDVALLSRLHIALYFDPISKESALKIWTNLLRRLDAQGEIDYSEDSIMNYVSSHHDAKSGQWKWSGRQIRNAFEMALNLAIWEARRDGDVKPRLLSSHLESIFEASGRLASVPSYES